MGAEHGIDRGRIDAGPLQPVEKAGAGPLVPGRDLRPVLVLADAGVDQEGPPVQAQDEGLDRAFQGIAGEIDEIRLEQAAMLAQRRQVEPRQELVQRQLEIVADAKAHVSSALAHPPTVAILEPGRETGKRVAAAVRLRRHGARGFLRSGLMA